MISMKMENAFFIVNVPLRFGPSCDRIGYSIQEAIDMRCGCPHCEAYMVQSETEHMACVCPDCGYRCNACLGTNTVVSRESIKALAFDPRFNPDNIAANFVKKDAEDDDY